MFMFVSDRMTFMKALLLYDVTNEEQIYRTWPY